jgi:FAD binding domain/Berberine and berberine like
VLSTATTGADVRRPGDYDWDDARRAWNLAVDQRPAAVAIPETVSEVAAVVVAARADGLRVAPQSTGHGATPLGPLDDTVLLRTSHLGGVHVDPATRTARVGAGVRWGEVVHAAAAHGLAPLAGSAPGLGVVGYTLGGGLGWLSRRHGLACNSVTAIELVTADGRRLRADAQTERDLFWALRGGGGSFGVVTALELALVPVPRLYAGVLSWPWERAIEVVPAWRDWVRRLPDEMTSLLRVMQYPPLPVIPADRRGRAFVLVEGAFLGGEADGDELLAPLRALVPERDSFARSDAAGLLPLHDDPPQPAPAICDSLLLGELPDPAVDAFVAATGPGSGSRLVGVELCHLGGALGVAPEGAGALGTLEASFAMFGLGMAATPGFVAQVEAQLARVRDAVAPWDAGRAYMNFVERPADPRAFFKAGPYRLLRQIKGQVDPDDVIRANHAIAPA